jgi:hypothetical protein
MLEKIKAKLKNADCKDLVYIGIVLFSLLISLCLAD